MDLMGRLLGRLGIGQSDTEGSDQWLRVLMGISEQWCPSSVPFRTSVI